MGISVVTGPATEPVTLAQAKAHCRIDDTDSDTILATYISAARQLIEGQIHRPLVSRMYDYTVDWYWPDKCGLFWIELPYAPLQVVRSISYVDANGATQVLPTNQYKVMTNRARAAITTQYNVVWPMVRWQVEAITVRFVAGYTNFTDTTTSPNYQVSGGNVPEDLVSAILFMVAHLFDNRDAVVAETRITPTEMPLGVEALISPYRLVQF